MSVDKNLFLYDLAVVAIMKNEGHYIKEWLDYHILAGVDHFFIYDNDSADNLQEILKPYIDKNIVTYKFMPGLRQQMTAYNDALKHYKFLCRYMAFIDGDEFILPRDNKNIIEVVDEILGKNPYAASLSVYWMMYGSNNLEKADYSKGVLERFTTHDSKCSSMVKLIANPQVIDYISNPHILTYFSPYHSINEKNIPMYGAQTGIPSGEKILINHYHFKSSEEYEEKINRGDAGYGIKSRQDADQFHKMSNDVPDDEILRTGVHKG